MKSKACRDRLVRIVLLEVCDDPDVLLDSKRMASLLGVSDRMARNYRRWLAEGGYVVIKRGRVLLTAKARKTLKRYYEKIGKALKA